MKELLIVWHIFDWWWIPIILFCGFFLWALWSVYFGDNFTD